VSPLVVAALSALLGAAVGVAWKPLVPFFGARSEDANEQPRWTDRATALPFLVTGSALAFGVTGLVLGWQLALAPGLVFCALLVGVTVIDLRYRIVPNRLVAVGTPLGLALQLALEPDRWLELVLATVVAFLLLFAVAVFSPGGMGMGDVKLAAMLGAFLGRAVSVALMSGLVLAAVPSILVLARFGLRSGRKETLPLGPFLALGGLVALLFGTHLLDWYWSARA
jgi:prepilin signal peptidase PulO-like enzyme (type II secretory pathway)